MENKSLGDRIFLVFKSFTQKEVGDLLGLSQDTISIWFRKKTTPKVDHLEKIISITGVDWEWLLKGKTSNIDAIANAYFPINLKKGSFIRPYLYEKAREISKMLLLIPKEEECLYGSGEKCTINDIATAISILITAAKDPETKDPIEIIEDRYENVDDIQIVKLLPMFATYYESCDSKDKWIKDMRACYIPPKELISEINIDSVYIEDNIDLNQLNEGQQVAVIQGRRMIQAGRKMIQEALDNPEKAEAVLDSAAMKALAKSDSNQSDAG